MKIKKEVIKHSAVIHIENSITLLQRKAWNVLLANAYDELPTEEVHSINVRELMGALGYDSHNDKHLKESLKELVTNGVEWNILEKDKAKWGVSTLLASAEIESGVCAYAYSPPLREKLYDPAMYAKINLEMQRRFSNKHALALFELFVDYFDESRQFGETPWIEVATFRRMMAIPDGKYPEFKKLNKWVIKDPIKQIHEVTDYVIDVEYKKRGRQIAALKFRIQFVPQITNDEAQGERVDTSGLQELVAEMVECGVRVNDAKRIWSQGYDGVTLKGKRPEGGFAEYVREKIDLLQVEEAKGKVEHRGAFLVSAIREDYDHPTYRQRQKAQKTKKQVDDIEKDIEKLNKESRVRKKELLEPLLTDDAILEHAFQTATGFAMFDVRRKEWEQLERNPREGFNDPMFYSMITNAMQEMYPEKFAEMKEYDRRIKQLQQRVVNRKIESRKRRAR